MDLTTFWAQLVSVLRVKFSKLVIRGKICFSIFGYFSKFNFFWLWHIFLAKWLSNELNFSVAVHIYKIHAFDEAFFLLTIRIPIITKLFRVVACCKELQSVSIEWSCGVTWQTKYISRVRINLSWFRKYDPFLIFRDAVFPN